MSEVQQVLLILLYKYGVNFTALIVFKLTICNYYFVFLNLHTDTFKKVANCVNYKTKLKQSNFERNAKNISGFEHFSSQICDIEKS
jgi:ABC-type transport system involved in Fe-S cluster assembly fused permease/ATPase subunit